DSEAAGLIYNENDTVGAFFYTNSNGSSYLTAGNIEKSIIDCSSLNYDNNFDVIGHQLLANYFPNVENLTLSQRTDSITFYWPLMELLKCWSEKLTTLKLFLFTEGEDVFGNGTDCSNGIYGIQITLFENLIFSLNNLPKLK